MDTYFKNANVLRVVENNESYRLKDYKDGKKRLLPVGVDDVDNARLAIMSAIELRLSTQRFEEPIFSANYGVNWEKFIGRSYTPAYKAELMNEIYESIMCVSNVDKCVINIERISLNTLNITIDVYVENVGKLSVDKLVTVG